MDVDQADPRGDVLFDCKISKREVVVSPRGQVIKTSKGKAQKTKIPAEGPDPRVPHLVFLP